MSLTTTTGSRPSSDVAAGRSHFTLGSKLSGDLSVPGLVELLGHVDGRVYADAIMIEESGSVDGELHAADVAIKGKLEGKIFGGVVKLHATAEISGEIIYCVSRRQNGQQNRSGNLTVAE